MNVELFNKRIKDIVDAASFKEPDKVPVGFEGMYWQYGLAGATLKELNEGGYSFEEHVKRYCRYLGDIEFDSDDPFEAKKVIGDHQVICGGFPLALLHLHDLQKCKDMVDRCFEELAPGGGYMFNMDKPLLSPSDGDIGLLKDLYGYINEKAKG